MDTNQLSTNQLSNLASSSVVNSITNPTQAVVSAMTPANTPPNTPVNSKEKDGQAAALVEEINREFIGRSPIVSQTLTEQLALSGTTVFRQNFAFMSKTVATGSGSLSMPLIDKAETLLLKKHAFNVANQQGMLKVLGARQEIAKSSQTAKGSPPIAKRTRHAITGSEGMTKSLEVPNNRAKTTKPKANQTIGSKPKSTIGQQDANKKKK